MKLVEAFVGQLESSEMWSTEFTSQHYSVVQECHINEQPGINVCKAYNDDKNLI